MRFRGVLLKPLADQHDLDARYIDPAGVEFDPERDYPISVEFNDLIPPVGRGRVSQAEDGSLVVEGEIFGNLFRGHNTGPRKLAIGVRAKHAPDQTELFAIALARLHQDPDQPSIEEIS